MFLTETTAQNRALNFFTTLKPPYIFKRKQKKKRKKKEKRKPFFRGGDAGLSRFLTKKILPLFTNKKIKEKKGCGDFFCKTRRAWPLLHNSVGLCEPPYLWLYFLFFWIRNIPASIYFSFQNIIQQISFPDFILINRNSIVVFERWMG